MFARFVCDEPLAYLRGSGCLKWRVEILLVVVFAQGLWLFQNPDHRGIFILVIGRLLVEILDESLRVDVTDCLLLFVGTYLDLTDKVTSNLAALVLGKI